MRPKRCGASPVARVRHLIRTPGRPPYAQFAATSPAAQSGPKTRSRARPIAKPRNRPGRNPQESFFPSRSPSVSSDASASAAGTRSFRGLRRRFRDQATRATSFHSRDSTREISSHPASPPPPLHRTVSAAPSRRYRVRGICTLLAVIPRGSTPLPLHHRCSHALLSGFSIPLTIPSRNSPVRNHCSSSAMNPRRILGDRIASHLTASHRLTSQTRRTNVVDACARTHARTAEARGLSAKFPPIEF